MKTTAPIHSVEDKYGIVSRSNYLPRPAREPAMLRQLLSITQTAERLRVRPEYVRELVAKKRLSFTHGEQLDAADVERLAALMEKLRKNGIATLVEITAQGDPKKQ
ncbi:MAG: hypothetical protein AAGC78_17890 [Cellvibrio sp.]|uniref:hypothetical protein n=1 Tax=Cellvibrio sp. TaxID=1965322 RepID=UPI0031A4D8B5